MISRHVIKRGIQAARSEPFPWPHFIGCSVRHISRRNTPFTSTDSCAQFSIGSRATSKTRPSLLPATMPRQLQPEQLLTPVPSDIAISDAIAPLPITQIAQAAGIVRLTRYFQG